MLTIAGGIILAVFLLPIVAIVLGVILSLLLGIVIFLQENGKDLLAMLGIAIVFLSYIGLANYVCYLLEPWIWGGITFWIMLFLPFLVVMLRFWTYERIRRSGPPQQGSSQEHG